MQKYELRERKKLRLEGYNYASGGAYFVTICVDKRYAILWKNVGANCVRPSETAPLSEVGQKIELEIQKLNTIYDNIKIDKYCIMPDHIHMIISIEDGRTQFAPTISRIIKQFKGKITKKIGYSIWQKSFNDRIIRDEKEYEKICKYIDENPLKYML